MRRTSGKRAVICTPKKFKDFTIRRIRQAHGIDTSGSLANVLDDSVALETQTMMERHARDENLFEQVRGQVKAALALTAFLGSLGDEHALAPLVPKATIL